jgi:hypothetical protein
MPRGLQPRSSANQSPWPAASPEPFAKRCMIEWPIVPGSIGRPLYHMDICQLQV